jgi:hypothetical protein
MPVHDEEKHLGKPTGLSFAKLSMTRCCVSTWAGIEMHPVENDCRHKKIGAVVLEQILLSFQ